MRILTATILFLSLIPCARAQGKPTLRLSRRELTVLGITIGLSTEAEVQSRLGKTPDFRVGEGGESEGAVCYRSAATNDDTIVVFYAGALGSWIDVTRISILASRALPWPVTRCRPSPLVSKNLRFLRGLMLGSTLMDVSHALGVPSQSSSTKLLYYVSHKCGSELGLEQKDRKKQDQKGCVVVDSVEAKFSPANGLYYVTFYHFVDQ